MQYCQQVWEQELYQELQYKTSLSWFHTFEADTHVAGLSFADESEASTFGSVIQSTLQRRRDKARGPAGSASRSQTFAPQGGTSSPRVGARPSVPTVHEQPSVKVVEPKKDKKEDKKKKQKKGKRRFNPADISGPKDFVHVTGMKLGSQGMEMVDNTDKIDPVLLKFLDHAGLKPEELGESGLAKAREVAEQNGLYDHFDKNASEGKKRRAAQRASMLPPPPKTPSRPPPTKPRQSPPSRPPPGHGSPAPGRRTESPSRNNRGPPPALPTRGPPGSRPPGPPKGGAGAPPPPPPPPPAGGGGPPPPPSGGSKPAPPRVAKPGAGQSLADQLKGAPSLKPPQPQAPKPSGGDGRANLMDQIRAGNVNLRKVDPDEMRANSVTSDGADGGITETLQAALVAFRMDVAGSSSEDDDSDGDSDSDEWDD